MLYGAKKRKNLMSKWLRNSLQKLSGLLIHNGSSKQLAEQYRNSVAMGTATIFAKKPLRLMR